MALIILLICTALVECPHLYDVLKLDISYKHLEHLEHNDLNDIYQYAYRRSHSTETALWKGHSDIAEALDEGSMTALIMLYLSAAFDVLDHPILLKRLEFSLESSKIL